MNQTNLQNYNIHWTLLGGQSHSWEFDGQWYWGHLIGRIIKLKIVSNSKLSTLNSQLIWQTYPKKDDFAFLSKYLRLDEDYSKIIKKINKDKHIDKAIKSFPNLRLINQGLEEGLLSYLFSANKNLAGIRKSIKGLRELVGDSVIINGEKKYMFPNAHMIYEKTEEELRTTGMGFRANYLLNAIERIVNDNFISRVENMNEMEARKELLSIKGVGEKIADCVLIYGMGFDNVSPLDIWGHRIVEEYYNLDPKTKYENKRKWFSEYFDGHAGWAGQFLYEYIRHNWKK